MSAASADPVADRLAETARLLEEIQEAGGPGAWLAVGAPPAPITRNTFDKGARK